MYSRFAFLSVVTCAAASQCVEGSFGDVGICEDTDMIQTQSVVTMREVQASEAQQASNDQSADTDDVTLGFDDLGNATNSIINGDLINVARWKADYPMAAKLMRKNQGFCSATIISFVGHTGFVLTAKHCVKEKEDLGNVEVWDAFHETPGVVKSVTKFPGKLDVALYTVQWKTQGNEEGKEMSSAIRKVCVRDARIGVKEKLNLAAYGVTETGQQPETGGPPRVHEVSVQETEVDHRAGTGRWKGAARARDQRTSAALANPTVGYGVAFTSGGDCGGPYAKKVLRGSQDWFQVCGLHVSGIGEKTEANRAAVRGGFMPTNTFSDWLRGLKLDGVQFCPKMVKAAGKKVVAAKAAQKGAARKVCNKGWDCTACVDQCVIVESPTGYRPKRAWNDKMLQVARVSKVSEMCILKEVEGTTPSSLQGMGFKNSELRVVECPLKR